MLHTDEKTLKCWAQTLQKADIYPKAVYCGPLKRAHDYAAIVLEQLHSSLQPIVDSRLNEIDYGNWFCFQQHTNSKNR